MTHRGLVVLRKYAHRIPAELDKGTLQAAGMTVYLETGPYGPSHETSGVALLVRTEDVTRAPDILGSELPG